MTAPPQVSALAHAKLNLSLRVLARETSGYHQIETLFCMLELADELEIELSGAGIRLQLLSPPDSATAPPELGPPHQNLAVRAATAFAEHTGVRGIEIRLTKRIPVGAGLGGGSSDAAAVLGALNRLAEEKLELSELLAIGARLGSDVPFFVARAPLALAWGRGGRILPLTPPPSAPVVLAVPASPVATASAYHDLALTRDDAFVTPPALIDPHFHSWSELAHTAHNDFEDVVCARSPLLRTLIDALRAHGALVARMTGTGSTVFGIFNDVSTAALAAARLREQHPNVQFIETRTLETIVERD